jgi:ABC-2 type transport system ATP-binding protein
MLEMVNCSLVWPGGRGLIDMELTIAPGDIKVICGANGAGKTTLLSMMAGLLRPSAGHFRRSYADDEAGFLPAADYLDPGLSMEENLSLVSYLKTGSAASWKRLMLQDDNCLGFPVADYLGMGGLGGKPLSAMSTGERRKVHVMASLIAKQAGQLPRMVIWDEPHNNLDLVANLKLGKLIQSFPALGVSLVVSSHVAESVAQLDADCLILKDGRKAGTLRLPSPSFVDILLERL